MDERRAIGMNREKQKQFMFLVFISILSFSLFLGTGCGQEKSCELPKIGCESTDTDNVGGIGGVGVSIPGCGGCLSSGAGWGCDTFGLWSQSVKAVVGISNHEYIVADSKNKEDKEDKDEGKKKGPFAVYCG